jgi:hypothetical protein
VDTPLLSDRSECAAKILNPPSWLFVCSALSLGDARPCVLKLQLKKRSSYYRRPRQNLSSRFLVISEHGIHTVCTNSPFYDIFRRILFLRAFLNKWMVENTKKKVFWVVCTYYDRTKRILVSENFFD